MDDKHKRFRSSHPGYNKQYANAFLDRNPDYFKSDSYKEYYKKYYDNKPLLKCTFPDCTYETKYSFNLKTHVKNKH